MADIVLCQPATCVEPLGKSDWVLKPGTLRINNYNMYVLRRFFLFVLESGVNQRTSVGLRWETVDVLEVCQPATCAGPLEISAWVKMTE